MSDPIALLGEHLRASGFDEDGIKEALGDVELWKAKAMGEARPPLVDEPLATLVSLLLVRAPVPLDQAVDALGPAPLDGLVAEGLLEVADGMVSARYQVTPWLGVIVAHDTFDAATVQHDHVLGGSRAAAALARGTVRVHAARTLDLGSASGVQAMLAARHSGHVVATDVNPRAVELVRVNARLNAFDNIEAREGSWFEPVGDERFDLIVANPPYVISPDSDLLFRDGTERGDELSRDVVRGVGEHLAPGGIGHVLCNWALRPGDEKYAPVERWVEELGCDALVLDLGPENVVAYAARWNEHVALVDPPAYPVTVERWLADYRELGIESIVFGLVVLRRRIAGRPWFRAVEAGAGTTGFGGGRLLRILDALDFVSDSGGNPPPLLDERLVLVNGHTLTHRMQFERGAYRKPSVMLWLADGFGNPVEIEPDAVLVLEALDGERSLSQVIAAVAAEHDQDPAELTETTVAAVTKLFELGMLERR